MKLLISELQYQIFNRNNLILSEQEKNKNNVYTDEKKYNYALKIWEDKFNLHQAYLFQKQNIKPPVNDPGFIEFWKGFGKPSVGQKMNNFPKNAWSWSYKDDGENYSSVEELEKKNPNQNNKEIVNFYKTLKFNFPIFIGLHPSPDIYHSKISADGTYWDGAAMSPIYVDPGPKPILVKKNLPKPVQPPKPIVTNNGINFDDLPKKPTEAVQSLGSPLIYGPGNSLIGYMNGRDFIGIKLDETTWWMSKVDRELLSNKVELNKYIRSKFGGYANEIK